MKERETLPLLLDILDSILLHKSIKQKTMDKKSTKAAKQPLKISLKKVGKNFIGKIDDQTLSATLTDEKVIATLKQKVEAYNLKNSDATKKAIIKILTPKAAEVAEKKERLETEEKGLKKLAKKKEKEKGEADVERKLVVADIEKAIGAEELTVAEVEALLRKLKKVDEVEKVAAPVQQGMRRHGEY